MANRPLPLGIVGLGIAILVIALSLILPESWALNLRALIAPKPAENVVPSGPSVAKSPSVSGSRVEVIDGDSLRVDGVEIRLHGIDAFEYDQTCGSYACGQASKAHMRRLTQGASLRCEGREHDRYGRLLAVCFKGSEDIGAAQVKAGLALAYRRYSDRYVSQEASAKANRQGVWAHDFTPPEDHRHR